MQLNLCWIWQIIMMADVRLKDVAQRQGFSVKYMEQIVSLPRLYTSGETVIEENVVVGGNTFVTKTIAKGTRVTVKEQELQFK